MFFNFATEYHLKHETIASAKEFKLSEDDYKSFVEFLSDKDYAYTTESEDLLASLEKTTKEEKYFDDVKEEYELLKQKLSHHKNDDLNKFKDEITKILETEIVGRYYYQKGQIEISLKNDTTLNEAIKTLSNKNLYNSVLAGTNK